MDETKRLTWLEFVGLADHERQRAIVDALTARVDALEAALRIAVRGLRGVRDLADVDADVRSVIVDETFRDIARENISLDWTEDLP